MSLGLCTRQSNLWVVLQLLLLLLPENFCRTLTALVQACCRLVHFLTASCAAKIFASKGRHQSLTQLLRSVRDLNYVGELEQLLNSLMSKRQISILSKCRFLDVKSEQ